MSSLPSHGAVVTFTLQQLRAATQAGGILGVSIKGQGNHFFVQVSTRAGQAVLITARSKDPRSFKSPLQAMVLLKQIGIVTGQFDLSQYSPDQRETPVRSRRRPATPSKLGLRWNRIAERISSPEQPSLDDPFLNINEEQARRLMARQETQQLSLLSSKPN
ncbi:MAG TPA: hypothetical protein PLG97_08145 [Alcaligenes sp.]|nr:hypothetical protein [Alcaligenes sp.]HRL27474.1 hypothetical protein [Alcaligenes sp.]